MEWTPQLLYDGPLYLGMNTNWSGLLAGHELAAAALEKIVLQNFGTTDNAKTATPWYSALACGPGIFGLGSHMYADDTVFAKTDPNKQDVWSLKNLDDVNGGITTSARRSTSLNRSSASTGYKDQFIHRRAPPGNVFDIPAPRGQAKWQSHICLRGTELTEFAQSEFN